MRIHGKLRFVAAEVHRYTAEPVEVHTTGQGQREKQRSRASHL
jgi:hypothetical protein